MRSVNLLTLLSLAAGCGSGAVAASSPDAAVDADAAIATAEFFALAIVPVQTLSASTFEVQVVAELLDPRPGVLAPPTVVDGSGASNVMVPKVLQ